MRLTRVPKRLHSCPACGGKVDVGGGGWRCADQYVCCATGLIVAGDLLVRERRSKITAHPQLVQVMARQRVRRLARRLGLDVALAKRSAEA